MKVVLIIVAAAALAVPVLSRPTTQNSGNVPSTSSSELKSLPPVNLQDFEGKPVQSDGFKGKIVVLDFWATWCVPCIAEVPMLNKLQEKYGDQGVKIIGVTLASGEAKDVKPFIARNKMKYTVLMGDDDQTYDLNVVAFPTTYVLTRDLKVFRRYIGSTPRKAAEMEADIQKLLAAG